MRVLVVDDDLDIAESTAMLLQLEGYSVRIVTQAAEIVDTATSFVPRAVLQDVNMPGLDLPETVRRLRAAVPGVCVLLFTASLHAMDEVQSAHADGLIAKPFDVADLVKAIEYAAHAA